MNSLRETISEETGIDIEGQEVHERTRTSDENLSQGIFIEKQEDIQLDEWIYLENENGAFTNFHENYGTASFRRQRLLLNVLVRIWMVLGIIIISCTEFSIRQHQDKRKQEVKSLPRNWFLYYAWGRFWDNQVQEDARFLLVQEYVLFTFCGEALIFLCTGCSLLILALCVGEHGVAHALALCGISLSSLQAIFYYISLYFGVLIAISQTTVVKDSPAVLAYIVCDILLSADFSLRTIPFVFGIWSFVIDKLCAKLKILFSYIKLLCTLKNSTCTSSNNITAESSFSPFHNDLFALSSDYAIAFSHMKNPLICTPNSTV